MWHICFKVKLYLLIQSILSGVGKTLNRLISINAFTASHKSLGGDHEVISLQNKAHLFTKIGDEKKETINGKIALSDPKLSQLKLHEMYSKLCGEFQLRSRECTMGEMLSKQGHLGYYLSIVYKYQPTYHKIYLCF